MNQINIFKENKEIFDTLIITFQYYNSQINLSSFNDYDSILNKHILDSLSIFSFNYWFDLYENRNAKSELSIADIGTGGGFPGLALAIALPNIKFFFIDSISKKCNAVKEIAQKCNLQNIVLINDRAENINEKFDITLSRAVAEYSKIYKWSEHLTKEMGRMYFYKTTKEPINDFNDKILYKIGDDERVIYEIIK